MRPEDEECEYAVIVDRGVVAHFAPIVAVNSDILEVLAEREQRRKEKQERRCRSR